MKVVTFSATAPVGLDLETHDTLKTIVVKGAHPGGAAANVGVESSRAFSGAAMALASVVPNTCTKTPRPKSVFSCPSSGLRWPPVLAALGPVTPVPVGMRMTGMPQCHVRLHSGTLELRCSGHGGHQLLVVGRPHPGDRIPALLRGPPAPHLTP